MSKDLARSCARRPCHAAGLAVELDGAIHCGQAGYDAERDKVLTRLGVRVLRISNQARR
ncbi:MAG: DUF559 domain-containing protein [Candidatus Binataceae bacterium]